MLREIIASSSNECGTLSSSVRAWAVIRCSADASCASSSASMMQAVLRGLLADAAEAKASRGMRWAAGFVGMWAAERRKAGVVCGLCGVGDGAPCHPQCPRLATPLTPPLQRFKPHSPSHLTLITSIVTALCLHSLLHPLPPSSHPLLSPPTSTSSHRQSHRPSSPLCPYYSFCSPSTSAVQR